MNELKYIKNTLENFSETTNAINTTSSLPKININNAVDLYNFLINYTYYPEQKIFQKKNNNAIQYLLDNVIFSDSFANNSTLSFNTEPDPKDYYSTPFVNMNGIGPSGALGLSVLLDKFKELQEIDLNGNSLVAKNDVTNYNSDFLELIKKITAYEKQGIRVIDGYYMNGIYYPEKEEPITIKILHLNFANNNIDNDTLIAMSSYLPQRLLQLFLQNNIFNDSGAITFINKLITNKNKIDGSFFILNENLTIKTIIHYASVLKYLSGRNEILLIDDWSNNDLFMRYFQSGYDTYYIPPKGSRYIHNMPGAFSVYDYQYIPNRQTITMINMYYYDYKLIFFELDNPRTKITNTVINGVIKDGYLYHSIDDGGLINSKNSMYFTTKTEMKKVVLYFPTNVFNFQNYKNADRLRILLYDIIQLNDIELNVSNTYSDIINQIPPAPIYKMINISNNNLTYDQLLSFFKDINLVYQYTNKNPDIKWLPQSEKDTFTIDNINTLNKLIGIKTEIAQINNNLLLSYTVNEIPNIDQIKENIKKELNTEDVIVTYRLKEGFGINSYVIDIKIIPSGTTDLNSLATRLNENIDRLLNPSANPSATPSTNSYTIYIIIFILLLILVFTYLKISHKI